MSKLYSVGVRNLIVTPITVDTVGTLTYGTPKAVEGVRAANWNLAFEVFEHRGDDQLLEVSQVMDKLTVEMEAMGMDLELMAILTGGAYDATCATQNVFCHNLQQVCEYYQVEFDALCTDGKLLKIVIGKAKISSGPAYGHADKTPGVTTFNVTAVKMNNQSGTTKGFSIRKLKA